MCKKSAKQPAHALPEALKPYSFLNDLKRLPANPWFRYSIYLLLLLPVFIFRDYTPPNELKYISISEEALRNNNWFTFYNQGELYADKPPLFFWLLMLSRLLTGGYHLGLIGLFSLLPALGTLAVMDRWMQRSGTPHNPLVSNLLLLTTAMFTGASLIIRMDMLMTFFIVLSLYTFFKLYTGKHSRADKWLLPFYIFMAVFSKGPLGIILPVASILVFLMTRNKLRSFGRYLGWQQFGVMLALSLLWFLMTYREGGPEYLNDLLINQTVGRGIDSFHHKEPLWFYFPRMLGTLAPWTLLYIILAWQGVRRKVFNTDTTQLFAVMIITSLTLLSVISAKLDIYMLPAYPFITYLCSAVLYNIRETKGVKIALLLPAVLAILVLPGFFIGGKYLPVRLDNLIHYAGVFLIAAGGLITTYRIRKNKTLGGVVTLSGSLLMLVFIYSFTLPQFRYYIGFREMAESAKNDSADDEAVQFAYYKFYTAPNMDVYLGQPLEYVYSVRQLDSLDRLPQKTILFVRTKDIGREEELKQWISEKEAGWEKEKYSWYVLGEVD